MHVSLQLKINARTTQDFYAEKFIELDELTAITRWLTERLTLNDDEVELIIERLEEK